MSTPLLRNILGLTIALFCLHTYVHAQTSTFDLSVNFTELNLNVQGGDVYHMEFHNDKLYLTGDFDGGFAMFDPATGTTSIPDLGLKGFGYQFTRFGDKLYVVGDFIMAGSFDASNIVAFDLETNTFVQPPPEFVSEEPFRSITTDDEAIYAVTEIGITKFTPTETGITSQTLTYGFSPEISKAVEPYLRSLIIGDHVTIGGQIYSTTDPDFDYFIFGRAKASGISPTLIANFLPGGTFMQPDESRVRDMIIKDDEALILRESGIIAYAPSDQFVPDPIQDPFYTDFIRPTTASSRLLHEMDNFLYMLAVNGNEILIGRQLLKGDEFRFNTDLSLNENFKNGTFSMASYNGLLFIAGPIAGSDAEQQVTLFSADLTADLIDWSLTLRALEGKDIARPLIIGTSSDASDDFDVIFDRMAPPLPPDGAFDARINPNLIRDFRKTTESRTVWEIPVIQSSEGGLLSLEWDPEELRDTPGVFLLDILSASDTTSINMRQRTSYEREDEEVLFIIRHLIQTPVSVEYPSGWFLTGSPQLEPFNPFTGITNAVQETLFGFNGAYTDETIMVAGQGYWLYSSDDAEATFNPPYNTNINRSLRQGWNLISGAWQDIPLNMVEDPTSILVPGSLYAFSNGYSQAEVIQPGQGYWIRASEPGEINISLENGVSTGKTVPESMVPDGFLVFEINHGEGHFLEFIQGENQESAIVASQQFSMPPIPPGEAFDIRFDNNARLANQIHASLVVRNPQFDLRFSLRESTSIDGQWLELTFFYGDEDTPDLEVELHPGEQISIPARNDSGLELTKVQSSAGGIVSIGDEEMSSLPITTELHQNYPNPFNPSTTIRYAIPEVSRVRLEVFNMLGQQVATLVNNEHHAAGHHTVQFDAGGLSSGVYVYRLQAGGTVITKTFTLMK